MLPNKFALDLTVLAVKITRKVVTYRNYPYTYRLPLEMTGRLLRRRTKRTRRRRRRRRLKKKKFMMMTIIIGRSWQNWTKQGALPVKNVLKTIYHKKT